MKPFRRLKNLRFKVNSFSQHAISSTATSSEAIVRYGRTAEGHHTVDPKYNGLLEAVSRQSSPNANNVEAQREACRSYIEYLPDLVLGQIVSYLHWKEKEWFVTAFPNLEHVIDNSLAWRNFNNDRTYAVETLMMYVYISTMVTHEIDIIRKYGRWFKSCTIWLSNLPNDEDNDIGGDDFKLLAAVSKYCVNLNSLHIKHNYAMDSEDAICDAYMKPLEALVDSRSDSISFSLSRLYYKSIETVESGIQKYMVHLQQLKILSNIVSIDFSHGLLFDGNARVIHELIHCDNLRVLKCPVQCLDTAVVKTLCENKLQDMFLVNDEHTYQIDFSENPAINWEAIKSSEFLSNASVLKVHYIFRNRTLEYSHMVPNPFVTSLVFDNLTSCITGQFLQHISNMYGHSLENLAFCSNFWEFLMQFTDLQTIDDNFEYVAVRCNRLTSFLSCLYMPSSALKMLAENSTTLKTLRVFKEKISFGKPQTLDAKFTEYIAKCIDSPDWDMLSKGSSIYKIPGVDNSLLFANCVNEI